MGAHRSQAEEDIRSDVVKLIRERWPNARIIHEININGQGSNRVDVMAVDVEDIAIFEIKSKKDKLDRLPSQYTGMKAITNNSYAVLHEKFGEAHETNAGSAWWTDKDGAHWRRKLPEIEALPRYDGWLWREDGGIQFGWNTFYAPRTQTTLKDGALHTLWAAELKELCASLRIGVGKRPTMGECIQQLRWLATGKEITRGICAQLRARNCAEADAPIFDATKS